MKQMQCFLQKYTLYTGLLTILKLMAPMTPHITEEIYQLYFAGKRAKNQSTAVVGL